MAHLFYNHLKYSKIERYKNISKFIKQNIVPFLRVEETLVVILEAEAETELLMEAQVD